MYEMKSKALIWVVAGVLLMLIIVQGVQAAETYGFVTKWVGVSSPHLMATDSSGNIYVVDTGNYRILKFDSTGGVLAQFGSSGSGDGQFSNPLGIAVNKNTGEIYVSDNGNNRIQKFTSGGEYVTKWPALGPYGIAVDSSDNVYVATFPGGVYPYHKIVKFSSDGTFLTEWGEYAYPIEENKFVGMLFGVAVDSSDNVYVADPARIFKFTSELVPVTNWGLPTGNGDGQLNGPLGVAVDGFNNSYVTDYENDRVQKFTSVGTFVTKWGMTGGGDGQFYEPTGIAVDTSGNVYVADQNQNRIQKFFPLPIAAFSGTPTSGTAPPGLTVAFTDTSTGSPPSGWAWFFGDEPWTAPWTQVTASPVWPARYAHTGVALPDGSIVIMGGLDNSDNLLNDVWRSTDIGASWLQQTGSAGWSPRSDFSSVAMPDGSIVVMGGTGLTHDVWRSTDNGASWMQQTGSAGWSGRNEHSSVAMPDGSIVLMGGWDGFNAQNDVWHSLDKGVTWHQHTTGSPWWSARVDHSSVAMPDGTIILMGGKEPSPGGMKNDIWRSTDNGETWMEMTTTGDEWSPRAEFSSVGMPDGSIIVMGGSFMNDVWRSTDNGAHWTLMTTSPGWTPRHLFSAVAVRDGSIVLMGGDDTISPGYKNDVWRFPLVGSSDQNPSHTYNAPGTYQVALQAFNAYGYSSTRILGYITVTDSPAAAPGTIIEQGATLFIGEAGLDITNALDAANAQGAPTTITTSGWWASAAEIYTMAPTVSVDTAGRETTFTVTQAEFDGYEGPWYLVDATDPDDIHAKAGADPVFEVLAPKLELEIHDFTPTSDVSGEYLTRGIYLTFKINTNMYPAVNDIYRSPLPEGYGYIDIIVKNPDGVPLDSLLTSGETDGEKSLLDNYVDEEFWDWSQYSDYWDTGALGDGGSPVYPYGTYTVLAESTLHGMKDNYLSGSAAYTGRTVSEVRTVTLVTAQEKAVNYVVENFLMDTVPPETALKVSDNYLEPGTVVTLWDGTIITSPAGYSSWLVFIDDAKNDNWDHGCSYVFVNDAGISSDRIPATSPPKGIGLTYSNQGHMPNPAGLTSTEPPFTPDPACTKDATHYWALLISGGIDKDQNPVRYYNDIQFMYKTLRTEYNYPKDHIIVLLSDGTGTTVQDQVTSYDSNNKPVYGISNPDLDGDGLIDVTGDATKTNILATLGKAPFTTTINQNTENLFIFTTNHGGWDKVANSNNVNLNTWGGETISDDVFVAALPKSAKSITMTMEQCFGGGFIDEFTASIPAGQTRVITTAAKGDQSSHSNDFSYYWISGMAGHDTASPTQNSVNADVSPIDFKVSMFEGWKYTNEHNPSALAGTETPQHAGPDTTQFLAACAAAQPRIEVVQPTNPMNKGTKYTIKWSSSDLPQTITPYVKVELRNGTGLGTWQFDIASTLVTNGGTGVPFTPSVLPGGPRTDYWIKIYTFGAPPTVSGQSGTFEIKGVTKAATSTLKITSNVTGALIDITDSGDSPVYINNVLQTGKSTNYTFTPLASNTYKVKVSKSCYYDLAPLLVKLLAGTSQTKPFILLPIKDCLNGLPGPYPQGSIAITSLPEEGFWVTLDGTNMQYNTPVLQGVGVGSHTVKLDFPGYISQTKTVEVFDDTEMRTDFTLVPLTRGWVIGDIMVPVDPVKVGTPVEVSSTLTYLGESYPLTAIWTWENGPTISENNVATGLVTSSNIYTSPGVYTVSLAVNDQNGLSASKVAQSYILVYDPNAGFVTGGGWITSPPGAYIANAALTGKATFGFVSKYQKGKIVPTGKTEFRFNTANLKFKSASYEWLVVAGPKAQFKGVGTINGQGQYGFMLTATDGALNGGGGTDKFRIKIWNKATNAIVYDNEIGTADTANPKTAIGGGSIIIHTGK
jgi:PKD repeat protein